MDAGINAPHVQFETIRKLRAAYSNAWGAGIHTMTMGVIAKDTTKLYVTNNPGYSLWFERFMKGMHSRMGDQTAQDTAISSQQMHKLMDRIEADYQDCLLPQRRQYLVRAGLFFMCAYLGSLRGEEVPRIVRKYFVELNEESLNSSRMSHCVLPLYGNFKGDGNVPRCYLFRIATITRTGFNMKRWVERSMEEERGSETMFLFADRNGKKESAVVYQYYLFEKLKSIQSEERGIIPLQIKIEEDYGISRSFRRGSSTAAANAPNELCSDEDIIRNNRWRREDRAGTRQPAFNMLQLYTNTLDALEADLRFSSCL